MNKHLMKPYAKIELDDRCSEKAFGIIAARFRIVNSPTNLAPEKVTKLVLAIAVLYNFLLTKSRGPYPINQAGLSKRKIWGLVKLFLVSEASKRHFQRLLYETMASRAAMENDKFKTFR